MLCLFFVSTHGALVPSKIILRDSFGRPFYQVEKVNYDTLQKRIDSCKEFYAKHAIKQTLFRRSKKKFCY